MEIKGRHVLITGAAKRIGRAIAEDLLKDDISLSIHFHRSEKEALELEAKSEKAFSFAADLSSQEDIRTGVIEAMDLFGPIDILINSASLFTPKPAVEVTESDWDLMHHVNLRGQFYFAQTVAPGMLEQKRGAIINIADRHGTRALGGYAPYTTSKAGLLHLTRVLAKEWAPHIRVNSVSPGPVLFPENYTEEQKERSINRTLLKREGSPEDIAKAVRFLIENDYLTGIDVPVDGGSSIA